MSGVITTPIETELSTMAAMRRGDQASALAFRCRRWRRFVKASSSQSSLYLSLAPIATSSGEILESLWLGLFAPNDCEVSLPLCRSGLYRSQPLLSVLVVGDGRHKLRWKPREPPTWSFHTPPVVVQSLSVSLKGCIAVNFLIQREGFPAVHVRQF